MEISQATLVQSRVGTATVMAIGVLSLLTVSREFTGKNKNGRVDGAQGKTESEGPQEDNTWPHNLAIVSCRTDLLSVAIRGGKLNKCMWAAQGKRI